MIEDQDFPCATCLRWWECNGVDADRCPLINEEGDDEEKIRLRENLPDAEADRVGVQEMVRRLSDTGDCPKSLCVSLNAV